MLYRVGLLCCITSVIVAGVPKPGKVKNCTAIGGRCVKTTACPKLYHSKSTCSKGKLCCAKWKKERGNGVKKRNSKGCKQKHRCSKSGGRCIPSNQPCLGRVKDGACKRESCQCCILKDGDRTENKLRGGKKNKRPRKGGKKEKGCKKKKKCAGFCVAKDEECLGEIDSKGCKGKHCSCCTLGEENGQKDKKKESSDTNAGNFEYDYPGYYEGDYSADYYHYNDYHYEDQCFGKNVNGSCEKAGCFICGSGQCHPPEWKCDYMQDCDDGSDELDCPPQPKYAPGSCPREYAWVLQSCYKVVPQPSSWSDARKTCRALNGDLGLIYDYNLFAAYMKAFYEIQKAVYWVGVHRDNGTYTWVNGTILSENSSLWGSTEGSVLGTDGGDCTVLNISENRLQPTSCEVDTYNNKSIYSVCEYADDDYYG